MPSLPISDPALSGDTHRNAQAVGQAQDAREQVGKVTSVDATPDQPANPLHGVKLEAIVTALADHYGWEELGQRINIRCFTSEPSVASSLKFLRKTPWAREKVESLYLFMLRDIKRSSPTQHNFPPPRTGR